METGISCKIIEMLKSMYKNIKSCVRLSNNSELSDFFYVSLGLKQGEPLSPLLFILFINDIDSCINTDQLTENDVNLLSMYLLLFADDIVLFTTDPKSLQAQIDNVHNYSTRCKLKINVKKTKICVFEKKKQNHKTKFSIGGEKLEIVDNFIYLGINFVYNGNMSKAVTFLSVQALNAYNNLLYIFDRLPCDIKMKLSLFDKLVVPILTYGSEIWGIYEFKEVEKIHMKFCKYILGVKKQTPNCAIYGELGRYPLSIICLERSLKYWIKVLNNPHSPMFRLYMEQTMKNNKKLWGNCIGAKLEQLGYGYLLEYFDPSINVLSLMKRRIRDQYIQEWEMNVNNASKLEYYRRFKKNFEYEKYLDVIKNGAIRRNLTCFRLSAHSLEIEVGRYSSVPRENRLCKYCNLNVVESENHFLLTCPKYYDLRKKYIHNISWPTLSKFSYLLSSKKRTHIVNISKFINGAFRIRKINLLL